MFNRVKINKIFNLISNKFWCIYFNLRIKLSISRLNQIIFYQICENNAKISNHTC